jgi:hypothetical protein
VGELTLAHPTDTPTPNQETSMTSAIGYFDAYDSFAREYDCRLSCLRASAGEALFLVLRGDGTWGIIAPSDVPPGTLLQSVRIPCHRGETLLGGWTPTGDALLAVPVPSVTIKKRFRHGRTEEGFRRAKERMQKALLELLAGMPA